MATDFAIKLNDCIAGRSEEGPQSPLDKAQSRCLAGHSHYLHSSTEHESVQAFPRQESVMGKRWTIRT